MRLYTWMWNVCFLKSTNFLEVLGMLGFKKHFLLIKALKRPILRGLERLVKSAKVKRVSALAVLLAERAKNTRFLDVFCLFWPRFEQKYWNPRGILTFLSSGWGSFLACIGRHFRGSSLVFSRFCAVFSFCGVFEWLFSGQLRVTVFGSIRGAFFEAQVRFVLAG